MSLYGRDILSIADLTKEELLFLIELSKKLKRKRRKINVLEGKSIALVFMKPSTRTRISMEVACYELGAHPLYIHAQTTQLARGEPIKDFARVLERYVHAIAARVYSHNDLVELAKYTRVPVINLLSDWEHPLQIIGDMLTIDEKIGLENAKVAFVGDGDNNVAHSLLLACALLGIEIRIGAPKGYQPCAKIMEQAKKLAEKSGAKIIVTEDPIEAVRGVNVIYTDVWVSMGMEKEREERLKVFRPYQVNLELVKHAAEDFIFMHCLPRHPGEEVSDDVFESTHSVVFDQAENRLHSAKAVLLALLLERIPDI